MQIGGTRNQTSHSHDRKAAAFRFDLLLRFNGRAPMERSVMAGPSAAATDAERCPTP